MASQFLQVFLVCAATWCLLRLLRSSLVKSALDNLPGPASPSIVWGNLKQIYDKQGWEFHRSLEQYGPVSVLHGRFGRKIVYVFDPKAMHAIAVKDQYIYDEALWFLRVNNTTVGPGLLATTGDVHRRQRKMLNPAFNINHMREMTSIFYEVTHKLQRAIQVAVQKGPKEINLVDWMGRTALELMGQAGLGHSFDPLTEESDTDTYGSAIKATTPAIYSIILWAQLWPYFEWMIPKAVGKRLAKMIPHKGFQRLRTVVNTLHKHSVEIYNTKKDAIAKGDEGAKQLFREGKDLMSIMLRANVAADEADKLPEDQLIGQMSTFTIAAMDTTSNALSIILHQLAKHPEAQAKLRQEILHAQSGGMDLNYNDLVELPYLDAVCRESLRLFAPAPFRFRETREDVILPLSEPVRGRDGRLMSEIPIPKNTTVFVGVISSNTRKALWGEDAYEWKPERWLSKLPDAVIDAKIPGIYSHLMTFWGGGRACIGFKFSQLEMKVVLAVLLSTFTFDLGERDIKWNMAGVIYPTVGNEIRASLPLKVGLVAST